MRDERQWPSSSEDQRTPGQRDRDRILYCTAFRRLAGVTQVVGPFEGQVFHNRLTHTLETAQIARRLAEMLCGSELANALGGVDPDVVEAAALIHDLGHPPFGHCGEEELRALAEEHSDSDGFEGNAQSFRIVTRLAAHRPHYKGLNLTRATLNASLKYPTLRDLENPKAKAHKKYGAYRSDRDNFEFARLGGSGDVRSVEAEIMDYADDVAYSVHDLDDFFRAGLIPLDRLMFQGSELESFIAKWKKWGEEEGRIDPAWIEKHKGAATSFLATFTGVPSKPTFNARARLRLATAQVIGRLVQSAELQERDSVGRALDVPEEQRFILKFCQRLVWDFVIYGPQLSTQQVGQRRVLRELFDVYRDAVENRDRRLVPPRFLIELDDVETKADVTRLAIDILASLTDSQAITLHQRVMGSSLGSVTDILEG